MSSWPKGTAFKVYITEAAQAATSKRDIDHCLKNIAKDPDNFSSVNKGKALAAYCRTSRGFDLIILIDLDDVDDDGTTMHVGLPSDFGQGGTPS